MQSVALLAEKHHDFQWTGNHVEFDSWGGRIDQEDVDLLHLGFEVVGPKVPMVGPCGMLFGGAVILADGKVNACGCRAVGGGLTIGDCKTTPLKEILSPDNPSYQNILQKHMKSDYPDDCINCKIFTSIYRKPNRAKTVSVAEHLQTRRERCQA